MRDITAELKELRLYGMASAWEEVAADANGLGVQTSRWLIERKPGALRNGAPFADLPAPMQKLRGLLLRREGGDRIMAKVLAAVPGHGLDAVLVAVELVLESGTPSSEHIENVLHRLKAAPPPPQVESALTIEEAPVADTHRYDRLRQEVSHA